MCRRIQATTTKGYTKFEDAKGVIRNVNRGKTDNTMSNGKGQTEKQTNNDRQITIQKTYLSYVSYVIQRVIYWQSKSINVHHYKNKIETEF